MCHRMRLMVRPSSITTSESADTEPVLLESRHQFRLAEFEPPTPTVTSMRTSSPVCAGIVLRVTAMSANPGALGNRE